MSRLWRKDKGDVVSYDVAAKIDGGHIDPYFDDTHPAFDTDGMAGTALLTTRGYARCGNYTSNVSGMWTKCLTAVMGEHDAAQWAGDDARAWNERRPDHPFDVDPDHLCLADLANKRMADIAPVLHAAVEWGVDHMEELREMNPGNGWGNAEGAITYLWDIARLCEQHPDATLYISL